jgi:quercetin dioxygenase-like cupin family protein
MKQAIIFTIGLVCGAVLTVLYAQQPETDPVKISPQLYKVRFENDRVRVLEYTLKPGEKEPTHSHPAGIIYALSDAKIRGIRQGASPSDASAKTGDVMWREPITHAVENIGTTDVRALAIEVKACQ